MLVSLNNELREPLTGGVREAEGGDAGAGLHEEAVGVAVVAAVELHDLLALRERSHQPEHAHARLVWGWGTYTCKQGFTGIYKS